MPTTPSDDDQKAALRSQIDENLRLVYNTALNDEVPERFRILLQQLRKSVAGAETAEPAPPTNRQDRTEAGS